MIIAAVDRSVVNVTGRVDRFDMVVAAAHYRAEHFTLAIGEVRADYDIVVFGVIVESVTRHPGETRPAPAVVAVFELDDAVFALETFKVSFGDGVAVVPARGNVLYRAGIVETLDLVSRGSVASDDYRLRSLIISAVVVERISHFVLARVGRGKGLVVRKRDRSAVISYARSRICGGDFLAVLDKFRAGYGDGTALGGSALVSVGFQFRSGNDEFLDAHAVNRAAVVFRASVVSPRFFRGELAVRKRDEVAVGIGERKRSRNGRVHVKRDFFAAVLFARNGNFDIGFLRRLDICDIQRTRAFLAVHQPAPEGHVARFPRVDEVLDRVSVVLPAVVSHVVIAAVHRAVMNVAGRVDRLDVVIAAAHYRAGDLACAVRKVRANDDIVVGRVVVEVVTRYPGETRPTAAALGVVELDNAALALEVLEPGDLGGRAVAPQRSRSIQRFYAVVTLDLVVRRGVANDSEYDRLFEFFSVYRSDVTYGVSRRERRVDLTVRYGNGVARFVRHGAGHFDVHRRAVLVAYGRRRDSDFAAGITAFVIAAEFDRVARNVYRYRAGISLARVYGQYDFVAAEVVGAETAADHRHRFARRSRDFCGRAVSFAVASLDVEHGRKVVVVAVRYRHGSIRKVHGRDFRFRLGVGRGRASDSQHEREYRRKQGADKFTFFHLFDFPPFDFRAIRLGFDRASAVRFFISL